MHRVETMADIDEKYFLLSQNCVYIGHFRQHRKDKDPSHSSPS